MMIIPVILFVLVLCWDHCTRHYAQAKPLWQRIALLTPSIGLFTRFHTYESGYSWSTLWIFSGSFFMVVFTYWLLINGLYNRARGTEWWYVGNYFQKHGYRKRMFGHFEFWYGRTISQMIKIVGSVTSVTVYLISYFKPH